MKRCAGFSALECQLKIVAGVAPIVFQRIVQRRGELQGMTDQARQWSAKYVAQTDGKQILRRRIDMPDMQIGIDQHDRTGEQIKSVKRGKCGLGIHHE